MSSSMIAHCWANPLVLLGPQLSVCGPLNTTSVVRCNRDVSSVVAIASSFPQPTSVSTKSDAFTVASDKKYESKQVISLSPCLYDYILTNVREPEVKDSPSGLSCLLC